MPGAFVIVPVTDAVFVALDAVDWPDGTVFAVTDDGNRLYEVRGADGAKTFVPLGRPGLPAGGSDGQVLTKQSSTDYAAGWETFAAATTLVPVANGDPDDPAYLFTPDGSGLFVEWS